MTNKLVVGEVAKGDIIENWNLKIGNSTAEQWWWVGRMAMRES